MGVHSSILLKEVSQRPVPMCIDSFFLLYNGLTSSYAAPKAPVSAPNISGDNLSLNSVVLEWSPIPEEDIRGFLLGYTISYMEYQPRDTEISKHHPSCTN